MMRHASAESKKAVRSARAPSIFLQRKCACGNAAVGGECEACSRKFPSLRRRATNEGVTGQVPPIVHEVLRSGTGRPLDPATRSFMEPRFGHDFSRVRVHSDAKAMESTRAVNALAYTVGHDVVFGAGQYAPRTSAGRALLAHELAHVSQQQSASAPALEGLSIGPANSVQEREADHVADKVISGRSGAIAPRGAAVRSLQRACGPNAIGSVSGCVGRSGELTSFGGSSANLYLFKVDCDEFAAGEEARLRTFAAGIAVGDQVDIDGFASEEGDPVFNENLSCARARAVWNVLAQEGVSVTPTLYMHGATRGDRTLHRSAVITHRRPTAEAEEEKPKHVCGPDVTAPVKDVIDYTKSLFGGWSRAQKSSACSALVEPPEAAFAWDILDLHRNAWILQYRCSPPSASCPVGDTVPANPVCATWGAQPRCGSTVQVGKECYYAGSPNYVIFGVMCKLCKNEFGGVEFSESAVRTLVSLYKLGGVAGANVNTAKAWAVAGYHGWPSGGTPPPGDRANCSPTCPTPYQGAAFTISWCPHENPYAECTDPILAIESMIEHIF